jgi:peptidoglycan/xylan/chitin deacetylase (PgdA/CDA1 family)
VTHRSLTEASPDEALAELVESRHALEAILGEKVGSFALPYGSGNAATLELARQAGYDHVFLSVPVASPENRQGRLVGRIDTTPTDWRLEYYLKIRGAYQWLPFGIAAKSRARTLLHTLRLAPANRDDRRDA